MHKGHVGDRSVLQNCVIFNDKTHAAFAADKATRAERTVTLRHGENALRGQHGEGNRLRGHEAQGRDRRPGRLHAGRCADARRPRARHDAALDAGGDEINRE